MKALKSVLGILIPVLLLYACDQNNPPVIHDQEFDVSENGWFLSWPAIVSASDPDGDRELSFEIIEGDDQEIFRVGYSSGELSVNKPDLIDYELVSQHRLKVLVSDNHPGDPLESSAIMRINVVDGTEFTDRLVAYYPFDGNASDHQGMHHGEVHGALLHEDRHRQSDQAYYFNGLDDYIELPDHEDFSFPRGHFTISFWVQALTYRETSLILSKGSGDQDREYDLGIDADSLFFLRVYERGSALKSHEVKSTTRVDYASWYHVSGLWNGSVLSLIVNGRIEKNVYCNATLGDYGSGIYIGGTASPGDEFPFHGVLDELYIHHREISNYEFAWLYQEF